MHLPHPSVKFPRFPVPLTSLSHPITPPSIPLSQLSRPHTFPPPENITTWHVLRCGVSTLLRGHICSCIASWLPAMGHSAGVRGETSSPASSWEGKGSNRLSSFRGLLQKKVIFSGSTSPHLSSQEAPVSELQPLGLLTGAGTLAVTFLQPTFVTWAR